MAKLQPNTTMVIREVELIDGGDMVINVLATRKGKEYKLPYRIIARNIPTVDLEFLKQKVIADIDEREQQLSKEQAAIDAIRRMTGKTINLD